VDTDASLHLRSEGRNKREHDNCFASMLILAAQADAMGSSFTHLLCASEKKNEATILFLFSLDGC
jgi:hypothetical protein